jgi:hypothetical protein
MDNLFLNKFTKDKNQSSADFIRINDLKNRFLYPYIPTIVVDNFYEDPFYSQPEMKAIFELFEKAKTGIAFYGTTKATAGSMLKELTALKPFEQLMHLIKVFHFLAKSNTFF